MCEPSTLAAMTAAQVGLSAISRNEEIKAQNTAAYANARNAKVAMNDEMVTSTGQYIEQQRGLIQGGFDAILEGRQAESTAFTSAIENGVQGASVKAVLRDNRQSAGRNTSRLNNEMDSLSTQQSANYRHIQSKAQGRINSVSTTKWGLGDIAKIAGDGIRTYSMG